ncbi:uncharacterized protein BJ171DRAFT_625448 [Polychytrium aggregatum]|uniref:uncharacterized protein n=1 Tax=Polychytrium aggregatum TaxID=110093 RepID=UPI0022FDD00A|nr:uncharacterized protein BJ171DRAFT_625448 [Polychytrium aggregatum]KAI9203055.1 hypothetical protein BJ171DRAFT_625448 [Polychytrium aggregatum]
MAPLAESARPSVSNTKVAAQAESHVEVEEVLDPELQKYLDTNPKQGLSKEEAEKRLLHFGRNEMTDKKVNPILKFLSFFGGSVSILLEIATIISAVAGDYTDFGILIFVLIVNACIGFIEESKAENALDALKNTLALNSRVWRDGRITEIPSAILVPGDVIILRIGDIIPADCRLLGLDASGEPSSGSLQIDQSALTGESLPVTKGKDGTAYSSSIVKQGQMLAIVTKTGPHTYIGRAAQLISLTNEQGHFQKIVNSIGNFLIGITIVMVLIILIYKTAGLKESFMTALKQVVVLTVAAIPIGLPTVMSVTMAVGAKQLATKQVIVKRLTSIEELASVSILCSDKTGTLTLNELTLDKPFLAYKQSTSENPKGCGQQYTNDDLLLNAFFASEPGAQDAIELAVRRASLSTVDVLKQMNQNHSIDVPGFKITSFTPFNPVAKYTEATVKNLQTGATFRCIKGAPHVITHMAGGHSLADIAVQEFALRGLRALGVARTTDEKMEQFDVIGMISLLDPPRPDSAATISRCKDLGVSVKMITGDQLIIAKEVAQRLGMPRTILDATRLSDPSLSEKQLIERVEKADGFAQVIPEHKFRVVELLQKKGYLVGMTGDGVNDAPALKKANVGIAVHGCTDAARSAADIVLLSAGLSTIVDGILCSRAIFQRMRSYAVYRITSTIHFLIFFFITILAWNFSIPDILIIMIAVLNDVATLVISVDNTKTSTKPDKWRLGQLLTLSLVLGLLLVGISFAHFFVARDVFLLPIEQVQTVMYLQISSCPHFVIFSTRLPSWFWENTPSFTFLFAVLSTQVFAMFLSIFGVPFLQIASMSAGPGVVPSSACRCLCLIFLDLVKVLIIRHWSFELTAQLCPTPTRREKLRQRQASRQVQERVERSVGKVRTVVNVVSAAAALQGNVNRERLPNDSSDMV